MRKLIISFIMFFAFIPLVSANTINSVKMDIHIANDGTAHITEEWNATYSDKTEGFKPYYNLGTSEIKNFSVKMDGREFEFQNYWDINGNFSDKAYKYGINAIDNGLELCFGISNYGTHTYTMSYDITNFVLELKDAQMVYWTLFPYDFQDEVESVYIKIYSDFEYEDKLDVWGFGNYGGTSYVYDGYIEMQSDGELDTDEYMTILIKYPLGSFQINNTDNNDFNYYLEMAQEGSTSYKDDDKGISSDGISAVISIFISYLFPIILVILFIVNSKPKYYQGGFKKLNKDAPFFRDIPCKGDIYRAYFISMSYGINNKETDFLGSILLRWLKLNQISIKKEEKKGLFGKETNSIVFECVEPSTTLEKEIYDMMYEASKDGILEENEFKSWCKVNYKQILNWFEKALKNENELLASDGSLKEIEIKKLGIFKSKTYEETPEFLNEANQLYGLKKYLVEFTNMDTKEAMEVHMWNDYLIYAQMFGIAEKVAKQFKKLYPEVITDYSYDQVIFIHNISYSGISSASSAKARAESYSAGGGGFSSGGGGGGSFGGGGGGGGSR